MKRMSSLEIKHCIKELNFLEKSKIEKIYQNENEIWINLYSPKYGNYTLYADPLRIHLTKQKKEPQQPSNYAMLLRKHLNGKIITKPEQYNFDRIVEINTKDKRLIIELFHEGNIVLTDRDYNIVMPLHFQKWKNKTIAPKEKYKFPKPTEIKDLVTLKRKLRASDRTVASVIGNLGFGTYSEEVCKRADIDKDKKSKKITEKEAKKINQVIEETLFCKTQAQIIFSKEKAIDVVPFDMKIYDKHRKEDMESFNKALDTFYSKKMEKKEKKESSKQEKKLEKKEKRKLEMQEKTKEKYKEKEKNERKEANLIYQNYGLVQNILNTLKNARNKYSWSKIKNMVQEEDSPEANAIEKIKEHEGKVKVNLNGKKVTLDLTKSVEKNASEYYETAKKLKRKKERAKEEIGKTKKQIKKIKKGEVQKKEGKEKKKEKKRGHWYEDYRYFWSLDNLLVVAGKDAKNNEKLIKKHTEDNDIVLHADIKGAPFVVIKQRQDKRYRKDDVTPQGVVEAGEFAASYSKAWQKGLGSVEVYWVKPEQVKKLGNEPTGTFSITGSKNYLKKIKLRLAIGADLDEKEPIIGPVKSVAEKCDYYVTIIPGNTPAKNLVPKIKQALYSKALYPDEKKTIENMEFSKIHNKIPSGQGRLVN